MTREGEDRLNRDIQSVIDQWEGTIFGYEIKNMHENGTDPESVCEKAGLDYSDYEED